MKCELCYRNNQTAGMTLTLGDVNGSNRINVCQPCLKKLKNAWRDKKPKRLEIVFIKEMKSA